MTEESELTDDRIYTLSFLSVDVYVTVPFSTHTVLGASAPAKYLIAVFAHKPLHAQVFGYFQHAFKCYIELIRVCVMRKYFMERIEEVRKKANTSI